MRYCESIIIVFLHNNSTAPIVNALEIRTARVRDQMQSVDVEKPTTKTGAWENENKIPMTTGTRQKLQRKLKMMMTRFKFKLKLTNGRQIYKDKL